MSERRRVVAVLTVLVAGLASVAALAGLLSSGGYAPATVRSVHGEVVELYGSGIYRYDTAFRAAGNRGTDLVTLAVALPLLLVALRAYLRGSLAGALLLAGALTWPLYVGASLALGTAYNDLFLVYVATFSASLFTLLLVLTSIDARELERRMAASAPRRRLAALMLAGGLVTAVVWLAPLLASLAGGDPPDLLDHSTTMVTDALDLGVITPATLVAALWVWRGRAAGYLVAVPLLVLMTLLLPMIVSQTVFQLRADVSFSAGEVVGPIAGFAVLAVLAVGLVVAVLRAAGTEPAPPETERELTRAGSATGRPGR